MKKIAKSLLVLFILVGVAVAMPTIKAANDCGDQENLLQQAYQGGDSATAAAAEDADPNSLQATQRQQVAGIGNMNILVGGVESINPCYQSYKNPYGPVPYAMARGLLGLTQDAMYYAFMAPDFIPYGEVYASLFTPKTILYDNGTAVYAAMFPEKSASSNAFSILSKMTLLVKVWLFLIGVATVILVVILIVAGFMIMFRHKVQGQTWVTLGMALQGVILGFIGAIASFAIGGFFFNFSKILVYFTAHFFEGLYDSVIAADMNNNSGDESTDMLEKLKLISPAEPASLIVGFFTAPSGKDIRKELADQLVKEATGEEEAADSNDEVQLEHCEIYQVACQIRNDKKRISHAASKVGHFFKNIWNVGNKIKAWLLGTVVGLVVHLAMGIAALVVGFKIFFKLVSTYINMIINIVLAPLIFVVGSLPGNSGQIKNWFKKMFMYSLIPPTMFFLTNFAYFLGVYDIAGHTGMSGMSALSGGTFEGGASSGILNIIGYGRLASFFILFLVPKAEDFLAENFGLKKSSAVEGATADLTKTFGKFIPGLG